MVSVAEGQVTIRDTVEIASSRAEGSHFRLTLMTSDTLVAPHSGTLVVRYDSAQALDSEINANADLTVTNNGQSLGLDTVVNRLGPSIQSTYFCTQPSTVFGDWFRYYPGQGAQDSLWTVGQVTEGDKIAFDYDGKRVGYTYLTGATSDSTWVGGAEGCYDLPVFYYEDAIWITVLIDRDTLDLQIDDPKEVWPSIAAPGTAGRKAGAFKDFDFSSVIDSIGATVSFVAGAAVQGQVVTVTAAWVANSGGHSHNTPPFPADRWLIFKDLDNPTELDTVTVTVTTDASGQAHLRFFAPPWGGIVTLTATTTYNAVEFSDVDSIDVRVPGLTPLTTLDRVGGTCYHHGPGNSGCDTPDDNHYAIQSVIDALENIASQWTAMADTLTPGNQAPLKINDMSLPNGGKFSITSNWEYGKHTFHRVGRDVDIRTQKIHASRTGVLVVGPNWKDSQGHTQEKRGNYLFKNLVIRNGGYPSPQVHAPGTDADTTNGIEHYHLYFYAN